MSEWNLKAEIIYFDVYDDMSFWSSISDSDLGKKILKNNCLFFFWLQLKKRWKKKHYLTGGLKSQKQKKKYEL